MGNISKSYGHDASKHKPKPTVRYFNGDRRLDRAPLGVTERWVDTDGHVVSIQLRKLGDLPDPGTVDRARAKYRRKGWTEQHLCPLTSGAMREPKVAKDLEDRPADLREACGKDPRTAIRTERGVELQCGCAHVEWLIKHRAQKKAERVELKRGTRTASATEVQQQVLEETRKTNAALVEAVKSISKKGRTE